MSHPARSLLWRALAAALVFPIPIPQVCMTATAQGTQGPARIVIEPREAPKPATLGREQALDAMKRATRFMVEEVGTRGGYVWTYLPDMTRRWGELEAYPTMIWVQPPGTPSMGHLFLDAYHATGDEFYYAAATRAADALIAGQLPCGGWNYFVDFGGPESQRRWYATIGRNAWRLEEFQHDWANATFDDGGTAEAGALLLRLALEKNEPRFRQALDRVIAFVVESQDASGAWPQRYPPREPFSHRGRPDYTAFLTFNDDVTAGNVEFLVTCYRALGDRRLLGPIKRGMNAFVLTQQAAPQAGWALQYTKNLAPAGARTYEPAALVTHTTAANVRHLIAFYRLTGDATFLARIPEALDWLERVRLPAAVSAIAGGRTHPTFVELGTNAPLYVHRRGSNVVNGEYYVDADPRATLGHYGSFREIDVPGLRKEYLAAKAAPPVDAAHSPLSPEARPDGVARYWVVTEDAPSTFGAPVSWAERAAAAVRALDGRGRWLTPLGTTSHPYAGAGRPELPAGDFSQALAGDDTDTSPYRATGVAGISTAVYIRHMAALIRHVRPS